MAGKGAAAAKSGFLAAGLVVLAPFLGIMLGVVSQWFLIRATTPAGRERRARTIELVAVWTCVLVLAWGGEASVRTLGRHFAWSDQTFFYALAGFWWLYSAGLIAWFMAMGRRNWAARQQRDTVGTVAPLKPFGRAAVAAGMHFAMFFWVIAIAWRNRDPMAAAVVVAIMTGMIVWNYFKLRGQAGLAAGLENGRHFMLCGLLMLAVLNLRMDVWLASRYEVSVAEIHRLFPMWLIPVLTLALLAWIGLVIALSHGRTTGSEPVKNN
jgi:hypothetical protein